MLWFRHRRQVDLLESLSKLYDKIIERETKQFDAEIERMERIGRVRAGARERAHKRWTKPEARCRICSDPTYQPSMAEFDEHLRHTDGGSGDSTVN